MRACAWLLFALFTFAGLPFAWAQEQPSLAEVARREAQRRKTMPAPGRVYTNADVKKAQPVPVTVAAARPAPKAASGPSKPAGATPPQAEGKPEEEGAPAAAAAAEAPVPEAPARDEASWRKRMTQAREQLERSRLFAEALQSRINALTTDFVNRDDPFQREQLAKQREEALAELDRVNREIADQTKAIADIEEEARRQGVPPGWLR